MNSLRAKAGDRLDTLCYLAYGQLGQVYLLFLEAQTPEILRKGILETGDIVYFPTITMDEKTLAVTRVWES